MSADCQPGCLPRYISWAPSPSRHPAERAPVRQFRQEGRDQVLAAAVKEIGQHDQRMASHRLPGPANASSAVNVTQPMVVIASSFFLAPYASAYAPTSGGGEHDRGIGDRQCSGPGECCQGWLPATTETK